MEPPAPEPALPWAVRLEVGRAVALALALSDESRLSLLVDLAGGERRVSELVLRHGIPQPTVSQHLNVLRTLGIARTRREGKSIFYSLALATEGSPCLSLPLSGLEVTIGRAVRPS